MKEIKRYEITWNAHEDAPVLTVEIDHSICTDKLLHQINNFFRVHYDSRCRQEQERGKAVRYGTGNNDRGNYEWWQIQVNNCRVTWEVR
ncbi:TPA: hypothetical protein G9F27_004412 [Salmonella enterica]|uniref:Uncharacterized protein n=1 Tax=Salmonella enterica TaxID=28901 RepID=A0A743SM58_SALER|nr:hypothetical protein [Salmonella enterica]